MHLTYYCCINQTFLFLSNIFLAIAKKLIIKHFKHMTLFLLTITCFISDMKNYSKHKNCLSVSVLIMFLSFLFFFFIIFLVLISPADIFAIKLFFHVSYFFWQKILVILNYEIYSKNILIILSFGYNFANCQPTLIKQCRNICRYPADPLPPPSHLGRNGKKKINIV